MHASGASAMRLAVHATACRQSAPCTITVCEADGGARSCLFPCTLPKPQLHQAQQRLSAMQSSSNVAGNQAAAAQARLRASVRCLESLHALLKAVLEQADSSRAPLDGKVRLEEGCMRDMGIPGCCAVNILESMEANLAQANMCDCLAASCRSRCSSLSAACSLLKAAFVTPLLLPPPCAQALRARLSAAVQELARMAKCQRELGSCLDLMRPLLQRMASGAELEGEEGGEDEGAASSPSLAPGMVLEAV